jgi:hypothetical protein
MLHDLGTGMLVEREQEVGKILDLQRKFNLRRKFVNIKYKFTRANAAVAASADNEEP